MADIVNLRAVRKTREREAKRMQGDENAAKFGLTRAERDRQTADAEKAKRALDGHERE